MSSFAAGQALERKNMTDMDVSDVVARTYDKMVIEGR